MRSFNKILPYLLAPILSILIFLLLVRAWNIDFAIPVFGYNTDSLFFLFIAKSIIDTGGFFTNEFVGLPHLTQVFSSYDFPIQSDLFSLLIIKLLSYFSHNPFLVVNYFFILTFGLISLSAFLVLRHFKIRNVVALGISILYAFLPYHFVRSTWHLFLSNYAIVPLTIMVAIWITSDKIRVFAINAKNQYCLQYNRYFFAAVLVSIMAANSGVYCAYYTVVIFIFALVIRILKIGIFDKNNIEPLLLCLIIGVILLALFLPTLHYQIINGVNHQVVGRSSAQSEFFALRIIDLFIPVKNHYIQYLSDLRTYYNDQIFIGAEGRERYSSTFGIIGATGFLSLVLWLIGKNYSHQNSLIKKTVKRFKLSEEEENLVSDLSALNLFSVFFSIVGGLVIFVSLALPSIRSHVRFCVFIAFIALFFIALILDKVVSNTKKSKKIYTQIAVVLLIFLGIFDQMGRYDQIDFQSESMKEKYVNDHDFIGAIEKFMSPHSMIFVLPASGFPELDDYKSLLAYLHSKNLHWSYPAIAGREADVWQKKVTSLKLNEFLHEIKAVGFSGVYIDIEKYSEKFGMTKTLLLLNFMKYNSKSEPINSRDKKLIFFAIQ